MADIAFKNIPQNLRLPLFYAELDNSQANTSTGTQRALIIGQVIAGNAAVVGVPVLSQGINDAIRLGGAGSMLAQMVQAYRAADTFGEVWLLPLADAPSSVAATGTITFTSAATANGSLALYIAGQYIPVVVLSTMTTAQIAAAVVAAIAANTNLPVTATVDGTNSSKVDIVAKNAGLCSNDIDIRVNYIGVGNNEVTPTGLAFTIVQMAGGATNPSLTTAMANLAVQSYDFIANPYTDTTNQNAMKAYLNDTAGAWSWGEQLYGHAFACYKNTFTNIYNFGIAENDQHNTVLGVFDVPTPTWQIAADMAATCAVSLRANPAQPVQTLALSTMQPPPLASRFPATERNTLLYAGISTFTVQNDGTCTLENVITTYQLNGFGQPDNSYLEIETMFTLMEILRTLRNVVTSKYARCELVADGTKFSAGLPIVTPSIVRGDLIAEYADLVTQGLGQDADFFADNLIVQQNVNNPNRLDVLFSPVLPDQLRIFAVLTQFRLIAPQ